MVCLFVYLLVCLFVLEKEMLSVLRAILLQCTVPC